MKFILLLPLFLFAARIHALEIPLTIITSDIDDEKTVFYLDTLADGTIDSMRYVTTLPSGQISEDIQYSYEEVTAGNIGLEERNGRKIVILNVENFSRENGGVIKLSYLYNGVTNSWKELKLNLARQDHDYSLSDDDSKKVGHMLFKGNFVRIFGLIGIREVQTFTDSVPLK